jgi:hypothetical protein
MVKHKKDKVSQALPTRHNKAGLAPQVPKVSST